MRIVIPASLVAIAAAAVGVAGGAVGAPTADDAAGAALVQKTCASCHEIGKVTTEHRTAEQWAATVDKMVGFGAQIPDADYDRIVAYLAAHQGPAK